MTRLYRKFQHLFDTKKGWDPKVWPVHSERLLRCPGSVKVPRDSRVMLPLKRGHHEAGQRLWPVRYYLVQYLTGTEQPLVSSLLSTIPADPPALPPATNRQPVCTAPLTELCRVITGLEASAVPECSLLNGIQLVVGAPCQEWPPHLQHSFFSQHMKYADRFKVVLFLLHHGVSQHNCLLWMFGRKALRDAKAKVNAVQLTQDFYDPNNTTWSNYTTFCMGSRTVVNVRQQCSCHSLQY